MKLTNAELQREIDVLKSILGMRESMRQVPPQADQVLAALGMCDDEQPQWRAVQAVLQQCIATEVDHLIKPAMTNEDAQYWRGRVAGLAELNGQLMQIREEGRKGNQGK